jgi:hypothetical protein
VLLNDGLNKFYGNFFGQANHPYARHQEIRKKVGGEFKKPISKEKKEAPKHNSLVQNGTIEFSFDENENERDF